MIAALIARIWGRIWPYIAAVGAVLAGLLAIRQSGKAAGRQEARIDQLEADQKAVGEAREERQKVDALGDDAARRDAARWVRRNK